MCTSISATIVEDKGLKKRFHIAMESIISNVCIYKTYKSSAELDSQSKTLTQNPKHTCTVSNSRAADISACMVPTCARLASSAALSAAMLVS